MKSLLYLFIFPCLAAAADFIVPGTSQFNTSITLSNDVVLVRDAANTLAIRNGTNANTLRAYNTYTDASNYERAYFRWSLNTLEIGSESAGTGSLRATRLGSAGVLYLNDHSGDRWYINNGALTANTANAYDISGARGITAGASGGFGSSATNTVTTAATGATNTLSYNVVLYVTAATSAALTDNAGTTEFSGVTIAAFTPIRLQPGGKFTGTSVTYATGTASHAW